jgi:phosphotransferase system enzyme I (PtsI)
VPRRSQERILKGIAASPGIAISKVFLLEGRPVEVEYQTIDASRVEAEIDKFKRAVQKSEREVRILQTRVAHRIGADSSRIFEVHRLLLQDDIVIQETVEQIRNHCQSADFAFAQVMERYQEQLSSNSREFFQSRVTDLKDISKRVIKHIRGDRTDYLNQLAGSAVLVGHDLTPSDTVALDKRKVLGFATDLGGRTSHVAVMARSMEVPAVVGLRGVSQAVEDGDRFIIDGLEGKVIIRPDEATIRYYRSIQDKYYDTKEHLTEIRDLPCITLDGKEIELSANLEFSDEVESVRSHGAVGVGLYRSDYLFLRRSELPDEEEQLRAYDKIARKISPDPVIIRTMDLGGDKQPDAITIPPEENPFLGWRAIRIALERLDIFNIQLRAILRASALGNVKILFPMISGIDEVREAKLALEQAKAELAREGIPFNPDIEIGVMIEVPSAALLADKLAQEVDFLSIGTNDLVQYILAVDRGNERISYLYKHLHPAVLRMLKHIINAGHQHGVWVGMCGEMAGDPLSTLLLLGLDLDEFSMSPQAVPEIKKIIRSTDYREAVRITNRVLELETASEVERFMTRIMRKMFVDLKL